MGLSDKIEKIIKKPDFNNAGYGSSRCPKCGLSKSPNIACPECFPAEPMKPYVPDIKTRSSLLAKQTNISDEQVVREITELFIFIKKLRYKPGWSHEYYPRTDEEKKKVDEIHAKIREIGYFLWENGGEVRMSHVLDLARVTIGHADARFVELWWDGIGTWTGKIS